MTHRGRRQDMERFFQIFTPLQRDGRLTVIPGNHDRNTEDAGEWLMQGERVQVASTDALARASISIGNVKSLTADARWAALGALIRDSNRIRGYGDFCHYHLLARGGLDLVLESDVNILDVAALAVIVREAGGVFTDLDGQVPSLETRSVLAGTPALHAITLPRLQAAKG